MIRLPGESSDDARARLAFSGRSESEPRRSNRLRNIPATDQIVNSPRRALTFTTKETRQESVDLSHLLGDRSVLTEEMAGNNEMFQNLAFALSNRVTRLNSKNYARWKRDMELRLKSASLWTCCITVLNPNATEAVISKDAKALTDIHESCEPEQQEIIIDCATAKDAWDLLKTTYEPRNAANTNRLWRELEACKKTKEETMITYVTRVKALVRALTNVGETVPLARQLERLMMGLGREYEVLKANLNLRTDLTEAVCIAAMMAEESRLITYGSDPRDRSRSPRRSETKNATRNDATNERSVQRTEVKTEVKQTPGRPRNGTGPVQCHGCGKLGHIAADCWLLHPELHPARRVQAGQTTQNMQFVHPQRIPLVQGAQFAMSYPQYAVLQYGNQPEIQVLGAGNAAVNTVGTTTNTEQGPHEAKVVSMGNVSFSPEFPYPVASNAINPYGYFLSMAVLQDPPIVNQLQVFRTELSSLWLIDSGATNHYTASRSLMKNFRAIVPVKVTTANGDVHAKGVGDVEVRLTNGPMLIKDVMWVPELGGCSNLLSVPQLTKAGIAICFDKDIARFIKDGRIITTGSFVGKAYYLDTIPGPKMGIMVPIVNNVVITKNGGSNDKQGHVAMLHGSADTQPIDIWHKRLGHLNQDAIKKLANISEGLIIGPAKSMTVSQGCDACLKGAQHRQVSHMRREPQEHILGCVHIDIKGPCLDKDLYGFRYFMACTDEKSRYTKTYPLREKKDAFGAFRAFEAFSERETGLKILAVHFDGGGEFVGNEFRTHLTERGIKIRLTAPYTPEMNAIAERVNRTLTEHASAMLWTACLPIGFWAPAVLMATYLKNRSPTRALDVTPYEAYYKKKPNVGFIRVFGCKAKVAIPQELRSKTDWDAKSADCILIGYHDTENLYDVWDVVKGTIIRARDVVFWETELGNDLLKKWALPTGISILPVAEAFAKEHEAQNPVPAVSAKHTIDLVPINQGRNVPKLQQQKPAETGTVFIQYDSQGILAGPREKTLPKPVLEAPSAAARSATTMFEVPPNLAMLMGEITRAEVEFLDKDRTVIPSRWNDVWRETDIDGVTEEHQQLMGDALWDIEQLEDNDKVADGLTGFEYLNDERVNTRRGEMADEIPKNYWQAKKSRNWSWWLEAMKKQLGKLEAAETWEVVDLPKGKRAIPCKWVYDLKDGTKAVGTDEMSRRETARLVARGDVQLAGIDYGETFAPVVKLVSLRMLLVLAAIYDVDLVHWDVVAAFLNGELSEEVFMSQPHGFNFGVGKVLRLKKSLYGLCQSSRVFYLHLDSVLSALGWKRLRAEWAVWIGPDGTESGFIGCHVDDMCVGASKETRERLLRHLASSKLTINDLGEITIYVGISITRFRTQQKIEIHQTSYIDKILASFGMTNCNPVATPMLESERDKLISTQTVVLSDEERVEYQRIIGCLLFLVHGTRPDIAYAVIRLSQFASKPQRHHWEAAKRVLRYLRGTRHAAITLGRRSGIELEGYFDAAHADNKDMRSTGGYVFLFHGSLVSWVSKVQRVIALSTTEAEYMAATEAARETIWITTLAKEIGFPVMESVVLKGDNTSSISLAKNPEFHQRTKHIALRERFINAVVESNTVTLQWVPTKSMLADSLTKPLPKDIHREHWEKLGLDLRYNLKGVKEKRKSEG